LIKSSFAHASRRESGYHPKADETRTGCLATTILGACDPGSKGLCTHLDYIQFNPVKHGGNKLPIFAALGIPEVWRHDGARVAIFTLVDDDYLERAESVVLPKVTSAILTELIDASSQSQRPA
jgi:hypothetical protein